jgi:RimJ/RimL family protein N-acetyltransferase
MLAIADMDSALIGAARLATGEYASASLGVALRPDQWGQGRGRDAIRLLHQLGFAELGLHRVWGSRSPLNAASGRMMQATGMIEEGTIRGHMYAHGAWRDSVVHSILREEFDGLMAQVPGDSTTR